MSDTTTASYNIQGSESLSLSSCPPVFVLPTHFGLEELHQVEEKLVELGARLTYDIFEATLILAKVGQKKRAALELRSRGLWTEEIGSTPPAKRRRTQKDEREESTIQPEVVSLDTESESEGDGERGDRVPIARLKRRRPSSPSASSVGSLSSNLQEQTITVVKIEWFDRCVEAQRLLSIDPYVVYRAQRTEGPVSESKAVGAGSSSILWRAKQDTVLEASSPSSPRHRHYDGSSRQHPPKLFRQTTSENEEVAQLPPEPDWVRNHVMYACLRSSPLHPPNEEFIDQLVKIRTIRELSLDSIGVRAYSTAIAAIAAYPYKLQQPSQVLSLPGCDHKIASLFSEFKQADKAILSAAEPLDKDPDLVVLHQFYNIWGVGPKTARDFYYARQWRDLDDIVEHGWNSLSRVQQIGLKYFDEFLTTIPRLESEKIAQTIHRHATLVRPTTHAEDEDDIKCIIVGSYRRGKPASHDVDLILTHPDDNITKNLIVDVVRSLESQSWITHTLSLQLTSSARKQQTLPYRGDTTNPTAGAHFDTLDKALVVWQDPHFNDTAAETSFSPVSAPVSGSLPVETQPRKRNPNPHRRVDIIISPWRTIGCAVLGWSGDTTFQRDIRRYVKSSRGWKFDSSGVRERTTGGNVIDLEGDGGTWEEREKLVMQGLGVGWRAPEERCTR